MSRACVLFVLVTLACGPPPAAGAPPLAEGLDEGRYIEGLIALELPEVLEHYLDTNPPTRPSAARWHALARAALERDRAADLESQRRWARAVIDARSDILVADVNDPRRARRFCEQAGDLYFRLLGTEAASVLMGVPEPATRERCGATARELASVTERASHAVDLELRALEQATSKRNLSATITKRRRLVDEERERRLPFLRGTSQLLASLAGNGPPNPATLESAARTLEDVAARLDGWVRERARLNAAIAWWHLGRERDALAGFEAVAASTDAVATDRRLAEFGVALPRGPGTASDAALDTLLRSRANASAAWALLVADQRALARLRSARTVLDQDAACSVYLDLEPETLGLDRQATETIVWNKIAGLADFVETRARPAAMVVAAVRAQGDRNPAETITTLERILESGSIDPDVGAMAMLTLGHAFAESGRDLAAIETLIALAERWPKNLLAVRALHEAAALGQTRTESNRADRAARRQQRMILDRLIAITDDDVDRYRYEAARLALRDGAFEMAVIHTDAIDPGGPLGRDAGLLRIMAMRGMASRSNAPSAWETLRRETQRAGAIPGAGDRERLQLRLFEAEAAVALDDAERAVELLDDASIAQAPDSGLAAAMMRVRITALRELGRSAAAQVTLDKLMNQAPEMAAPVLHVMLDAEVDGATTSLVDVEPIPAHVVELAERLETWARGPATDGMRRDRMLETVADVYRLAQRPEDARVLYADLLSRRPGAAALVFGYAETLYALGPDHAADAMTAYRRLAAGGTELGHDLYWAAQLRMLQLLDRVDRNTHQIVPRIRRLRQQDADLGGESYRKGFLRLEIKHSGG